MKNSDQYLKIVEENIVLYKEIDTIINIANRA
jgi:hypothetical protein